MFQHDDDKRYNERDRWDSELIAQSIISNYSDQFRDENELSEKSIIGKKIFEYANRHKGAPFGLKLVIKSLDSIIDEMVRTPELIKDLEGSLYNHCCIEVREESTISEISLNHLSDLLGNDLELTFEADIYNDYARNSLMKAVEKLQDHPLQSKFIGVLKDYICDRNMIDRTKRKNGAYISQFIRELIPTTNNKKSKKSLSDFLRDLTHNPHFTNMEIEEKAKDPGVAFMSMNIQFYIDQAQQTKELSDKKFYTDELVSISESSCFEEHNKMISKYLSHNIGASESPEAVDMYAEAIAEFMFKQSYDNNSNLYIFELSTAMMKAAAKSTESKQKIYNEVLAFFTLDNVEGNFPQKWNDACMALVGDIDPFLGRNDARVNLLAELTANGIYVTGDKCRQTVLAKLNDVQQAAIENANMVGKENIFSKENLQFQKTNITLQSGLINLVQ